MFESARQQGNSAVKERTTRQLRRRFISYSIRPTDSGRFELVDIYEELDTVSCEYIRKEDSQLLSESIRLEQWSGNLVELAQVLNNVRRELEKDGLKMFFDPGQSGEVRPKWRYRLVGRTRTDYMMVVGDSATVEDPYKEPADQVPFRVSQLVRRNYNYHSTPEWKIWFGRKIQRKREEIIINTLLEAIRET